MEIATTKLSSRGQLVIPAELRKNLKVGEKLVVFQDKDSLIIKKSSAISKNFEHDLARAKKTDKLIEEYESGIIKSLSEEEFLAELEK